MRNFWGWRMLACGLCLLCASFGGHPSEAAIQDGVPSIRTTANRRSELDLEVGGERVGFATDSVRYISREELLKLPQVSYAVDDDANFSGKTEISGVLLTELMRSLGIQRAGTMVVAICIDQYHAHYSEGYVLAHQPLLALKINGLPPAKWPANAEVRGAAMGPFLISHAKFLPAFKILAHDDQPQIPWGVTRLDFRKEAAVMAAIAPQGARANDESVQNGFVIVRQNCFRCHDNNGEGGKKSGWPWPAVAAWAQTSPSRFAAYVRNPQAVNAKSQMAPSPQYDDATMQALIEYFKTFVPENKH